MKMPAKQAVAVAVNCSLSHLQQTTVTNRSTVVPCRGRAVKQPPTPVLVVVGTPPDATSEAGSETSDSASEEEEVRRAISEDRELQFVYRKIYRPEAFRRNEVGSNDVSSSSCMFSIGDVIRPIYRLADLQAYRCGARCQVVGIEEDGDPIVSYYEPNGELSLDSDSVYATHFEKVCTTAIFDEHPQISHSTWETVLNSNY